MSIQTTYLRPEDDPANWFTGTEVTGPAIVTAVIGGFWLLFDHVPPKGTTPRHLLEIGEISAFHKLFVPAGHCLRRHVGSLQGLISEYRLSSGT